MAAMQEVKLVDEKDFIKLLKMVGTYNVPVVPAVFEDPEFVTYRTVIPTLNMHVELHLSDGFSDVDSGGDPHKVMTADEFSTALKNLGYEILMGKVDLIEGGDSCSSDYD